MFNTNTPIPNPGHERPERCMNADLDARLGWNKTLTREGGSIALINASGRAQDGFIATICAQVIVPPTAYEGIASDRHAPILGLLEWGHGSARFQASIDLRTGVCATVVATSVTVNAIMGPAPAAGLDTRALSVECSAAVVWGTRPGRARATRTLPRTTIANAGTATFEVPPFADSVRFFVNNSAFYGAASTSVVTLHGGPSSTDDPELIVTAGLLGVQPLTMCGVALSGDTRFVSLINNSGGDLIARACFDLTL